MGAIGSIRDGLQTRLDVATNLRPYDTWPGTFNPPGAIVTPKSFGFTAMGGADTSGEYQFDIVLAVQASDPRAAQNELDGYLALTGAGSVIVALLGDHTLGGACEDLNVSGWHDYGGIEINGVPYLGVVIDVVVLV